MKGRVIIIDNETTPKMIVKEKYVLARTLNVELLPYVAIPFISIGRGLMVAMVADQLVSSKSNLSRKLILSFP